MKNWRWAETPQRMRDAFPALLHWVEFRADDGRWYNPDCGSICDFCGRCLGCAKKLWSEPDEDGDRFSDPDFSCKMSEDGEHHIREWPG